MALEKEGVRIFVTDEDEERRDKDRMAYSRQLDVIEYINVHFHKYITNTAKIHMLIYQNIKKK